MDFFGSLFTTAIVNWAKWLHPIHKQNNVIEIANQRTNLQPESLLQCMSYLEEACHDSQHKETKIGDCRHHSLEDKSKYTYQPKLEIYESRGAAIDFKSFIVFQMQCTWKGAHCIT